MTDLPSPTNLLLQADDGWMTVWFNRPEARNALSEELVEELAQVVGRLHEDRSIRGVTFRGKGGMFCAGGDLKGFKRIFQGSESSVQDVARSSRKAGELFEAINTLPQVVVMLVEGAAMAGGLGIACAGDIVAVTRTARFALTETTLGIPPAQIAPFVVQRIGLAAARRIMLTAHRFGGEEAAQLGIADHVVDDTDGLEAIEAAVRNDVRRCAPGANAWTKRIVLAAPYLERPAMLDLAAEGFARCMLSDAGREGVSAFLEKRRPTWSAE